MKIGEIRGKNPFGGQGENFFENSNSNGGNSNGGNGQSQHGERRPQDGASIFIVAKNQLKSKNGKPKYGFLAQMQKLESLNSEISSYERQKLQIEEALPPQTLGNKLDIHS